MIKYVEFTPHNMTARDLPAPYVIDAEFYLVGEGYSTQDNETGDAIWVGYPGYLVFDSGASRTLYRYEIKAHDRPTQMMMDWTLSGSNDGINYSVISTITGETAWASDEVRSFICDVYSTAYRYFRFDISGSTGGVFVGMKEFYFYEIQRTNNIELTSGSVTISIKKPHFGYASECVMPLKYARSYNSVSVFDAGSQYDYRLCRIPRWLLSAADQSLIENFLNITARRTSFTLSLGTEPTGFFPFGPDKGDVGDFTVSLVNYNQGSVQYDPLWWFNNELVLKLETAPAYSPASVETEGAFSLGTVGTIRFLQTPASTRFNMAVSRELSRNGVVNTVDLGAFGDSTDTEINVWMKRGNAAALMTYVTGTARGNDFTVNAPMNSYLFGIKNGSSGVYTVKNLNSVISMTHERVDRWTCTLNLWLKNFNPEILEFDDGIYEKEDGIYA